MRDAVIVASTRSPIARFRGSLKSIRPDDLASQALSALLKKTSVSPEKINEVFLGCANQAGEDNRNVARMATLLAGFPFSTPAVTVNRLCASGLEAINQAVRMVQVGDADCVIAGGVESMTRAPYSMPKPDVAFPSGNVTVYDTTLGWRYPNPALESRFPLETMGETAENLVNMFSISRQAQDEWALRSHQRASNAQAAGKFADEIFSVKLPARRGEPDLFSADEGPRLPRRPLKAPPRLQKRWHRHRRKRQHPQ
jgi:acetyl-CoA acyltransferase